MSIGEGFARAQASALRFDFSKPLDSWTTVSGKWAIEDVAGASQGRMEAHLTGRLRRPRAAITIRNPACSQQLG